MKNKCNTTNIKKNEILKRAISFLLSMSIPTSLSACSKNVYETEDDSMLARYIDSSSITSFADRQSFYEIEDDNYKNLINSILNIKYYSSDNDINNLYNKTYEEWNSISKDDYYSKVNYPIDYSWLNSESINENDLYNKVINNCDNNYIVVNDNIEKIARTFIGVVPDIIKYAKDKNPNIDLSLFYHYIDNMYFSECYEENCLGYFSKYENLISINLGIIHSDLTLKNVIIHELTHAILCNDINSDSIYSSGISIDNMDTLNSSLTFDFLEEFLCSDASCDITGDYSYNEYNKEREAIDLLCKCTNSSIEDLKKVYFSGDPNKMIDLFESELQNLGNVYGLLEAADIALGYGNENIDEYKKSEYYNYYMYFLILNYNIHNIKSYYNRQIDTYQFDSNMNYIINEVNSNSNYMPSNNFCNSYEQLNSLTKEFVKCNNKY